MYDSTNVSDVDRFVCLYAGGGGGWGQVLPSKIAKPLISDSEKCASGEKNLLHYRFYKWLETTTKIRI